MTTTRRDFLLSTGAAGLGAGLAAHPALRALTPSAPKKPRTLVSIYLRGGADWLNMIIPYRDSRYLAARPTLALTPEDGVVELTDGFGLHPALAPLGPWFEKKTWAPVLDVGSPHPTRSHFDAMDFMEYAAPGLRTIRDGWLNRFLQAQAEKRRGGDNDSEFRALAMQDLLPRSLRGRYPVLAVPLSLSRRQADVTLRRFEEFYGDGLTDNMRQRLKEKLGQAEGAESGDPGEMPAGMDASEAERRFEEELRRREEQDRVLQSGRQTIATLRRFQEILDTTANSPDAVYPNTRFGGQMKKIAQVIRADAGLEICGVDYNGWDHHAGQGALDGRHAVMLDDFARSMDAFLTDLEDRLENLLVIVMTEFGRTVKENGNSGTDHGRGGGMFLFGGGVRGGDILGEWRGLDPAVLADGRDLPVAVDFRDVMAATLEHAFDFDLPKDFFPDYKPKRVRLFR